MLLHLKGFTIFFVCVILFLAMKTIKFALMISLLIVILISTIIIFSASYFSWDKKEGFKIDRQNKIRLICYVCILAAAVALVILWAI